MDIFKCNKSKISYEIEIIILDEDDENKSRLDEKDLCMKSNIYLNFKLLNGSKFEYRKLTSTILRKIIDMKN